MKTTCSGNLTLSCRKHAYKGQEWHSPFLPTRTENWLHANRHGLRMRGQSVGRTRSSISKHLAKQTWQWPSKEVVFITDLHADADALKHSLCASGCVTLFGPNATDFTLNKKGRKVQFIFGGDYFDKGPSNLKLLDALYHLINQGADVKLLAGNHDIRTLVGMMNLGNTDDPRNGHFFIRMGVKALPFFKEIKATYLNGKDALNNTPSTKACRKAMFPSEHWWKRFPKEAEATLKPTAIRKELEKIRHKVDTFEAQCAERGLSLREVYAATLIWQRLFLDETSQYGWFLPQLKLLLRRGSFLFLHAGVDDLSAKSLHANGIQALNAQFQSMLYQDAFSLYYSPIANLFRTKYRCSDLSLSHKGTKKLREMGLHTLVHGHNSRQKGQRLTLRKGLLHLECDVTLDRHSRTREGLKGPGSGVTLIHPEGSILAISSDVASARLLEPEALI